MEHIQVIFFESAQFPGRLHGQSRSGGHFKGLGESLCGCHRILFSGNLGLQADTVLYRKMGYNAGNERRLGKPFLRMEGP